MGGMFGKPASEYEVFSKPLTPGDGPPASALVIVNPYGGGGRGPRTLDQVQPILESAGIALEVAITARAGHAIELARDATHPCVIVIGGDGTLHEAIQGR
jgi:diacylglycerol kinase (ATP)